MNLDERLLRQARKEILPLVLTIGCGWLAGIVLVGQAYCLSRVISRVFLDGQSLADVAWLLILLAGLAVVRSGLTWAGEVAAQRVAGQVKTGLRQRLTAHLFALGPAYVQGERTGELSNTVTEGIESLDAYFGKYVPQLATAALVPLTIFAFIVPLDPLSGLILLVTAPLIPFFMILIGNQADRLTKQQWTALSRMSAHFLDVLQGLTTLKILGRARDQIRTIAQISDRFRRTTMAVLRVAFLSALVLEMLATIGTALVAVEIGLRLLYGRLAFEQALFVLILAPEFYLPLRLLGARFHDGINGSTAARRFFEILDVPARPNGVVRTGTPSGRSFDNQPLHVSFEQVWYAYTGGQRPALYDVSFHIPSGTKTALVGPSGAGKSTIVHLLLRFFAPDRGQITVNGTPLERLDVSEWRKLVGWVPQDAFLFNASILHNIRLARPETSLDEVVRAAQLAHAHTFIQSMPLGYDTLVGEQGARLSKGQAQRIALARAFLKDAPFLVLDEATSGLDPAFESQIQASVAQLVQGRSVLMVAHRLSTVTDADRILVVDAGRIVESGTHAELVAREGLYRHMVGAYVH